MRSLAKSLFRYAGLEVSHWDKSPMHTLLGLRGIRFHSIVDGGANEGQFARWISTFFPLAHIYAFEPLPGPYAQLKLWARTRPGTVSTFNLALGESAKDVTMSLHIGHTSSSSLLEATRLNDAIYPETRQRSTVVVKQDALDDVLSRASAPLEREILVKLDVQGYEDRVIAGARRTLARARACILEVILDELYSGQAHFPDLVKSLSELGFRYAGNLEQNYAADGHVIFLDAVFVRDAHPATPTQAQ